MNTTEQLTATLAETIVHSVGVDCSRTEAITLPDGDVETITLFSGGLVVDGYSRWANRNEAARNAKPFRHLPPLEPQEFKSPTWPTYKPEIAVMRYVTDHDTPQAGDYVFEKTRTTGRWTGNFVKASELSDDNQTGLPIYFMFDTEPLKTTAQLETAHNLLQRFKLAVLTKKQTILHIEQL